MAAIQRAKLIKAAVGTAGLVVAVSAIGGYYRAELLSPFERPSTPFSLGSGGMESSSDSMSNKRLQFAIPGTLFSARATTRHS